MLFTQAEQRCTPCTCYYCCVNSQLHQLYIIKNHRPTVHVFLLHCKPRQVTSILLCNGSFAARCHSNIQSSMTLQFKIHCPGPRGFTFAVILRGIHDCTVHQGLHSRVNGKFLSLCSSPFPLINIHPTPYLIDVLSSSPCKTARIITTNNMKWGVVRT